jgi:HAD superfamily hydrolase (TIGR01490 family)
MKLAFFDVDETLIYQKSMFAFMEFWYACLGERYRHESEMRRLMALVDAGAQRSEVNRAYYEQYAYVDTARLFDAGQAWFDAALRAGPFFKPRVVERLRTLSEAGWTPVFVSGSMQPILQPIAKALGVRHLLCAELETAGGRCTGRLTAMAIGTHKRDRLLAFISDRRADGYAHHAYGDHISDLPMLLAVQHPHAVDPCPLLREIAVQKGWPILMNDAIS